MSDGTSVPALSSATHVVRLAVCALREAPLLTGERARRMTRAVAIGIAVSVPALVVTSRGKTDLHGTVPGGDFLAYWVAARLAAAGHAADAYVPGLISGLEHRLSAMQPDGFLPYYYPPVWLVLLLPLAGLPYIAAWLTFCAVTAAPYILAIRRLLPEARRAPGLWFAIAGFPGLLVNAGNGQNGFVTGACFAGYGALLNRRPLLAGASLGLLCVKPQFVIAIPVALLAARRVRPLVGAVLAGASLTAVSVGCFGFAPWQGFLGALPLAREMLGTHLLFPFKTAAVLGSLRLLGVPGREAYPVQLAVSLGVLIVLAVRTASRPGPALEAALLAAAALLVTPYATDYDLTVAAVAMAVLFSAAQVDGFLPWEKTILAAAYVLPLAGPALARGLGLPVVPIVLIALFAAASRRARLLSRLPPCHARVA